MSDIVRYSIGSWPVPTPKLRSWLDSPVGDLASIRLAAEEALEIQYDILEELQSQGYMVEGELVALRKTINSGFSMVTDAIEQLEAVLCAELQHIRIVLSQIDDHLAHLVTLIQFPRKTLADELIVDGVKAMATGYLDDAETCLTQAVDAKPTYWLGRLNLAFVYLHRESRENAQDNFERAVAYSQELQRENVIALEGLARFYYTINEFNKARETQERAINKRASLNETSTKSEYRMAVYNVLSGYTGGQDEVLLRLCDRDPDLYSVCLTDPDLSTLRGI